MLVDKLGGHTMAGVRQAAEAVGACGVYLPTDSPHFDPIELGWADLKRQRRQLAPRTVEDLAQAARQ
ncbi:transposase [Myxococcaceae bacterium JPH2]|nr:transposase [Myxococcaceae bacterium JPH2]